MFYFAAVGIEDAVTEIGLRAAGGFYYKKLVEAYAGVAVCPSGDGGGFRTEEGLAYGIHNHEVVAQAVHFGEFEFGHCGFPVVWGSLKGWRKGFQAA